ncbi:hypothetical protein BC751_1932 [Cecembia calidifontis]|uniref:Uncharacterized protein n=1 Tax=Cecembia calidifontis TaxID=1187080 RepID=A0A4Q7P8C5_9BACT|nr:hypothetical protein BC751_1932 [Cecembia calidifontis]
MTNMSNRHSDEARVSQNRGDHSPPVADQDDVSIFVIYFSVHSPKC